VSGTANTNAVPSVDLDALLCALTLVPTAFARNRFFKLFENPAALKVRRRVSVHSDSSLPLRMT